MSEHEPATGDGDSEPDEASKTMDDVSEAELIREVVRLQQRHREGGIDAGLGEVDVDAGPSASE